MVASGRRGLITTAYQAGSNIYVAWGDSSPFNYDFHIVRWNVDGVYQDQDDVVTPRTGGWFVLPNVQIGHRYDLIVEGCDELGLPGQVARCRQGWHNPVTVFTTGYPLSPDLHIPGPPARGHWSDPATITDIVKNLPYDKIGAAIAAL